MKPIFGTDVTRNKRNENMNGTEFITRMVSKHTAAQYDAKQEDLEQTVEKSKLPLWLRIVKYLMGGYAGIVIIGTLKALSNVSLEQALKNAPGLIVSGVVCGVLWGVLHVISKYKAARVLKADNADGQIEEINRDVEEIYRELDVPGNALSVDVLVFRYKEKGDKIVPHTVGLQTTAYMNFEVKMFASDEAIHMADLESVYTFAKSELKAITTVNKRISVPSWNKDCDPRKGEFKPYKMTVSNTGDVFFKPYHILEIERNGQTFGLYFPCYELAAVEALTGLRAE